MVKYSDELHLTASKVVKEIEGYKGDGLTTNEMQIIGHYEQLLSDRPAVETEKIKKIAYDTADFTHQLGFIRNYFDLLSLVNKGKYSHDDLVGLHISLFDDGGLQNIDEILRKGSETLNKNCDSLLDTIED
ncbi:hypothetical protein [Enterococcus faecalis]|nr:hypothetical protein [Enterococcus faecalis]EGO9051635.1 hypothetical protein [Enterococcus faecalis]EHH3130690.1 hypothetical protein [Enterococcus faecalis]KAJ61900.1 hypothetical protein P783_0197 [Enterococcus faecalis GA2]HAP2777971.1 hypothetical protein [Enterococcus faecalis]